MNFKKTYIPILLLASLLLASCDNTDTKKQETENKFAVNVITDGVNLNIDNTYTIATANEEIPASQNNDVSLTLDQEGTEIVILADKYDRPILIGRKFKGDSSAEVSIETTAEMFLLQSQVFFGISISDDKELSQRIRSHSDFPRLVSELKESIETGSPCPTSQRCSRGAAFVASKIASELDFTDLAGE